MTTIIRRALVSGGVAAVALTWLAARRLGIFQTDGTERAVDVLLLFAGICFSSAASIMFLLCKPVRDQ